MYSFSSQWGHADDCGQRDSRCACCPRRCAQPAAWAAGGGPSSNPLLRSAQQERHRIPCEPVFLVHCMGRRSPAAHAVAHSQAALSLGACGGVETVASVSELQSNSHLQTPSPVRIGASSFFATPGFFPGTPVSEAMAAASWLQELTARSPGEVRLINPASQLIHP